MREIKFRAFDNDPETMQMIYSDKSHGGDYWFTADDGAVQCLINCCYCDSFGDEHDDWKPLDNIMQYTGLKDKNGKEIYEGDIVKYNYNNQVYQDVYAEVEYIIAGFRLNADYISRHLSRHLRIADTDYYEVVGNIYENPELLTV